MNHRKILEEWGRRLDIEYIKHDAEHRKLREWMVEKYGKEAVERYERKINEE